MLVLDSSVTLTWYVPDEHTDTTQALLDRVGEFGAVVPLHWRIEVGNALLIAMRRRRISVERRDAALQQLVNIQLTVDDQTLDQVWARSLALAEQYKLTLYDACYLELAQRLRLPLASLDRDLRAAGETMGIELLGL